MSTENRDGDEAGLEELLTRQQLARTWRTSTRTIDRYVASGELEVVRLGRSVRIRPAAAGRLLSKLTAKCDG